jgi:hypothetical protein
MIVERSDERAIGRRIREGAHAFSDGVGSTSANRTG